MFTALSPITRSPVHIGHHVRSEHITGKGFLMVLILHWGKAFQITPKMEKMYFAKIASLKITQ